MPAPECFYCSEEPLLFVLDTDSCDAFLASTEPKLKLLSDGPSQIVPPSRQWALGSPIPKISSFFHAKWPHSSKGMGAACHGEL